MYRNSHVGMGACRFQKYTEVRGVDHAGLEAKPKHCSARATWGLKKVRAHFESLCKKDHSTLRSIFWPPRSIYAYICIYRNSHLDRYASALRQTLRI